MPLRLIERVLPWLVGSLSEEEAKHFLKNMHMAGDVFDFSYISMSCDFYFLPHFYLSSYFYGFATFDFFKF